MAIAFSSIQIVYFKMKPGKIETKSLRFVFDIDGSMCCFSISTFNSIFNFNCVILIFLFFFFFGQICRDYRLIDSPSFLTYEIFISLGDHQIWCMLGIQNKRNVSRIIANFESQIERFPIEMFVESMR